MSNIFEASNQWMTRPDDERFATLAELSAEAHRVKDASVEALMQYHDIRLHNGGEGSLYFEGGGVQAEVGNYFFDTLCQHVGAPANFLRKLTPRLVAENINHLMTEQEDKETKVLGYVKSDGALVVRGATGPNYERIWDCYFADQCGELETRGWRVPPARPARSGQPGTRIATEEDCLGNGGGFSLSIKPGMVIAPAGIYRSDHDLWVFMVHENPISQELSRFFILSTSEVYGMAVRVLCGYYRHVCGNHIIWGASGVREVRIIHNPGAMARWDEEEVAITLKEFSNQGVNDDLELIDLAKTTRIGQNKQEVVETIYNKRLLTMKQATSAFDAQIEEQDGDPLSVWGFVNGVTRLSQEYEYAERRSEMDRVGQKVLKTFVN